MTVPNYNRAARMAYRTLLALRVCSFPVDPLQILSFCKNARVHTFDELVRNYEGYEEYHRYVDLKRLLLGGRDALLARREFPGGTVAYELFFDDRTDPRRVRFTLAHELGHIILKHRREEEWEEKEADYFAVQLLAPDPVFAPLSATGMDMAQYRTVSELFFISSTAARRRVSGPVLHQPDEALYAAVRDQFSAFITAQNVV